MKNYSDCFAAAAERFASRAAIEVQRRDAVDCFTYSDLRRMAEQVAAWLVSRGLQSGDRCAILAENDARWCAAFIGILRLGAIAVPLDTTYKPRHIAALLADSGARLLLTTPRFLAGVEEAARDHGAAAEVVLLHGNADGRPTLDTVFADAVSRPLPACPAERSDAAAILYTSGTTSDPKGVVLTHGNFLAVVEAVPRAVPLDHRDTILGVLPLFHALALTINLVVPLALGARVVFLETVNSTELLRALTERGPTAFCCVPQFFYLIHQRIRQEVDRAGWAKRLAFRGLLRLNGAVRSLGLNLGPRLFAPVHRLFGPRMRLLVSGGSSFDHSIQRDFYRMGINILQGYGLTECCGPAVGTRVDDFVIGSVGTPLEGVEVKILPREAGPEAEVQDGEVALRGPILMQGYWNRPDATAAALRDGWLFTGDLGYLDGRSRLCITGRRKEVIVLSTGKNIYPEEVEAHYAQSPYIKEICVLALARGEEGGERLHAVVVPDFDAMRQRKVVNSRELLRFEIENLSLQLPGPKRVRSFEVWAEELPRTTTRKLKRFEIERRVRERAAATAEEAAAEVPPLSEDEAAWLADPVVARALDLIREIVKPASPLRPDVNLELGLGLDSMQRVELLTHLEEAFGAQVSEEAAAEIYTLRDLVEAVRPREAALGAVPVPRAGNAWARLFESLPEDDRVLTELDRPKPLVAATFFLLVKLFYLAARVIFRLRVRGREHLPASGPFLLCPNHQSYIDAFLLVSVLPYRLFRQVFFVGASEYFASPLMRRVARLINLVPVDPDANLLRAMQAGAYGLRQGKVLVLFPEGERSVDGEVKRFKKGASILSLHLKVPIVPVALDGLHRVWPRGTNFPRRLASVRLQFGPPVSPPAAAVPETASLAEAEARYAAVADELRARVLEMWSGLRRRAA